MAHQTSIYIPDELLVELSQWTPDINEQSIIIAEALRNFFATHKKSSDDLAKINAFAEELNQEAEDVLDYQVMP